MNMHIKLILLFIRELILKGYASAAGPLGFKTIGIHSNDEQHTPRCTKDGSQIFQNQSPGELHFSESLGEHLGSTRLWSYM